MSGCIPEAQANLASLLFHNPQLGLAGAVAWLEPIRIPDVPFDESPILIALNICNMCFPDLYEKAMLAIWSGASYESINWTICIGINENLAWTGMDDLEQMMFGIPFECFGADTYGYGEDSLDDAYPELLPILVQMGYVIDSEIGTLQIAERIADILANDLKRYPDVEPAQHVRMLLLWLFNSTGYDLADYSNSALSGSDVHFDWSLEQIAFVNTLENEALDAYHAAMDGRDLLTEDRAWKKAFKKNAHKALAYGIKHTLNKVARGFDGNDNTEKRPAFTWPGCPAASC